MKNISTSFSKLLLIASLMTLGFLTNCSKDPAPTPVEKVTQILTASGGTWTPASTGGVIIDGIDVTADLFPGFSITFSKESFTTTGTTPVWLRQDSWRFKDETATVIIRGQDDKEITIEEISNNQMKLTLDWTETTYSGGRKHSLAGKHEFYFNK